MSVNNELYNLLVGEIPINRKDALEKGYTKEDWKSAVRKRNRIKRDKPAETTGDTTKEENKSDADVVAKTKPDVEVPDTGSDSTGGVSNDRSVPNKKKMGSDKKKQTPSDNETESNTKVEVKEKGKIWKKILIAVVTVLVVLLSLVMLLMSKKEKSSTEQENQGRTFKKLKKHR